ncbi:MAG TPA: hypothetical protein VF525_04120 [Pyrinomonadaceae bacterium]|jgi:hypothetical protein
MNAIACQSCRFVNSFAADACAQCGASLSAAKLQHTIDELQRVTKEVSAHTAPRKSFYTFNGFGTTLLDYRALADGTYEATRWVVALMLPLVPLATYVIRPETQEHSYGRSTSKFTIVGTGKLTAARVVRTYLLTVVGLLPLALGFLNSRWVNRTLGGPLAALAMFASIAWAAYIVFVRVPNEGRAYKTRSAPAAEVKQN